MLGDFPEIDEGGKEKWPRGDEKVWKDAMRGVHGGTSTAARRLVPTLSMLFFRYFNHYQVYCCTCADIHCTCSLQSR